MVPEIWSPKDITFCHFGPFFALYPNSNLKNENFEEKMNKKPGDTIILHKCTKNHDHMLHCSWDVMHDECNFYFSFLAIFCPPPEKSKFKKNEKNAMRYHHFTQVYQKLWSYDVQFLRYCSRRTDGQTDEGTDRRTERRSHI